MIARLSRVAASFVAVLAIYWLYALIAVPFIEPTVKRSEPLELTQSEREAARSTDRDKHSFAKFFQPGDWELEGTPKVIESAQAKMLVKDYRTLPDGSLELMPCTLVFYPNAGKSDRAEDEQVILMRAKRALLQFDGGFDLKRYKVGKLMGGRLEGKITIASAPAQPNSEQDLLIETQDVELVDNCVWTPHPVSFRFGKSHGRGREMRINLIKTEGSATTKGPGANFGDVESFELLRDVKLHVQLDPADSQNSVFGGSKPKDKNRLAGKPDSAPEPPVEVTCMGPFKFDMARSLATFTDQVDVLRLNPEGPGDQLQCELLAIQFGPRESKPSARAKESARNEKRKPNKFDLEPRRIEAVGDPVVIRAPSQGGYARCQRLEYEIKSQRIVMEGSEDISLLQGSNELRTRKLDYRPGVDGRLGWLEIPGPGWLQGASEKDPSQKFQAQWTKSLRMRPQDQSHVVSMLGSTQVRSSEFGTLGAEEIHLWLLQAPASKHEEPPVSRPLAQVVTANYAPGSVRESTEMNADYARPEAVHGVPRKSRKPADDEKPFAEIVPDRLMAQGNVQIDSVQLTGGTRRLEVWFQQADESAGPLNSQGTASSSGGTGSKERRSPKQSFDVRGDLVRLQLLMGKVETQVHDVTIEGAARLVETKTADPEDQPLHLQGDRLQVAQATSPEGHAHVTGRPAMVEARGMALIGSKINLDRGTNQLWIDGPGRMRLPMDRGFDGQPLAQTQTMEIDWQGGMRFDGKSVIFDRTVTARGEHQNLKAESIEVTMRERIDFGNPPTDRNERDLPRGGQNRAEQRGAAAVESLSCRGGVTLQNKTFETTGQVSTEQMQMREITINQVSGVIDGHGPGWITSIRRGGMGEGSPLSLPNTSSGNEKKKEEEGFTYLNVRFEGPIGGNVHKKEITFSDQVRAIYGPVAHWEAKIDPDAPDDLGPEAMLLNTDQLVVRMMPALARGGEETAEIEALGNTLVEGQSFTARAHKLAFAQAKDQMILEGNASADAQIFRQAHPGAPMSQSAAKKIVYSRSTNHAEFVGVRYLDLGNITGTKPGKTTSDGGFPNLYPNLGGKKKPEATSPDARRSPRGNGTALPSFRR